MQNVDANGRELVAIRVVQLSAQDKESSSRVVRGTSCRASADDRVGGGSNGAIGVSRRGG